MSHIRRIYYIKKKKIIKAKLSLVKHVAKESPMMHLELGFTEATVETGQKWHSSKKL